MHKRNEMMDRPVINAGVRDFLRTDQWQLTGFLKELQDEATTNRNPVIPHETVTFFVWLLGQLKPTEILEIGTAIGFSASVFASYTEANIQTIERNPEMVKKAKHNFEKQALTERVQILEGQAEKWLEKLPEKSVDFIFMDSAKAKYYDFFPNCMRILKQGGVLAVDDVLQGGTILEAPENIPRRVRKIHQKMNMFLRLVLNHPALTTSIIPVGDGLLLITKEENIDFEIEENLKNSI